MTASEILDIAHIESGIPVSTLAIASRPIHDNEQCTCAELGECLWTIILSEAAHAVIAATREVKA